MEELYTVEFQCGGLNCEFEKVLYSYGNNNLELSKSDLIGEVVLLVVWSLSEVLHYRYCLGETSNRGIHVQHSQITVFLCFMPIINTF